MNSFDLQKYDDIKAHLLQGIKDRHNGGGFQSIDDEINFFAGYLSCVIDAYGSPYADKLTAEFGIDYMRGDSPLKYKY